MEKAHKIDKSQRANYPRDINNRTRECCGVRVTDKHKCNDKKKIIDIYAMELLIINLICVFRTLVLFLVTLSLCTLGKAGVLIAML